MMQRCAYPTMIHVTQQKTDKKGVDKRRYDGNGGENEDNQWGDRYERRNPDVAGAGSGDRWRSEDRGGFERSGMGKRDYDEGREAEGHFRDSPRRDEREPRSRERGRERDRLD